MYLELGTYNLGTYSLAQPIWDLGTHSLRWLWGWGREDTNIDIFGVGDLQSGNLQSRATDLGSLNAFIALLRGAGVLRTVILMYLALVTYSLRNYN